MLPAASAGALASDPSLSQHQLWLPNPVLRQDPARPQIPGKEAWIISMLKVINIQGFDFLATDHLGLNYHDAKHLSIKGVL
ncbi:hypothetical protein Y1Q_0014209 [Alligator mississippiensis]|uniref:Uncharacterized protein n=1 Tax=Alligator mississippiensis TaxID=8496 RepID=A0A151MU49_ALLMI|nr:hypothetical protein Y1Q_0014209 [Alligator mississippiensis]